MNLYLIGLPGSGKTTLGKKLAQQLQLHFYDLDAIIEEKEEQSISNIFAQKGESYFRQAEANTLRNIARKNSFMISTGGGTPCFHSNMEWMKTHGITVWLDPKVEEIVKRMNTSQVFERPLFKGKVNPNEIAKELKNMLAQRKIFYRKAHIHLKGNRLSLENALIEIKSKSLP